MLPFLLSLGNVDDRKPVSTLTKRLWGKLFGDKGYISRPLFVCLFDQDVQFITLPPKKKKTAETQLLTLLDKILAHKQSIIETINDQLKNIFQIVHTRHRSPTRVLVNLIDGLHLPTPKTSFAL